ncbi:MxaS protein [Paraburkholderia sp. CNPSo 3157]|uniref:MxaS protein n=1 Tax=Paraburkholderia franconis TaxID=2654983 RepID=A0A7X1NG30_9BURK|nr:VWA domain-containing protein [Paraburkholderia franconis]MPW20916.1 MxaS protein [Paraburkholderia franconis]
MNTLTEFQYRLPMRVSGARPGGHRGSSVGIGQEFAAHTRLFDYPDPRRIDVRASVRTVQREWLVRVHRQRVAVAVHAVVDVSGSMRFGAAHTKLDVAATFVEALGHSAFRIGDPVGMIAFDDAEREDLFVPARHARGMGALMGELLRASTQTSAPPQTDALARAGGLRDAVTRLAGRACLVFLVSDFHWPLDALSGLLDTLTHAWVVPIVIWDRAEIEPPSQNGWMSLADIESGEARTMWMRDSVRNRWRNAVAERQAQIVAAFARHGIRPFFNRGAFNPEALSRYFLEMTA